MQSISGFGRVTPEVVVIAAAEFETPFYLYDASVISGACAVAMGIDSPYGFTVRYSMKANSTRAILKMVHEKGLHIDAGSLLAVERARMAGIPEREIILTPKEISSGEERKSLESLINQGLIYNIGSKTQLQMISELTLGEDAQLSIRINTGVGSGGFGTTYTGGSNNSFGIQRREVEEVIASAYDKGIVFKRVHSHVGSGGDPSIWKKNVDRLLVLVKEMFPQVDTVNFGGGFKVDRMPDEEGADLRELCHYANQRLDEFYTDRNRKLKLEIEPGTYIVANAGFVVATVTDKKIGDTNFVIADAGMESNVRPMLYGAEHPIFVVSQDGQLLSSEYDLSNLDPETDSWIVTGTNCEEDSWRMDEQGNAVPVSMAEPEIGDLIIMGGCGAYCRDISPGNYGSKLQIPEIMLTEDDSLVMFRKRQTSKQLMENEL